MRRISAASAVLAVAVLAGCTTMVDVGITGDAVADLAGDTARAVDAASSGCGPAEAPKLDRSSTPIENQRTRPIRVPFRDFQEVSARAARDAGFTAILPTDTVGLDLRYRAIVWGDLVDYFSDVPIGDEDTNLDLMKEGGIIVVERPASGVDLAKRARTALGDGGALVAVGSTIATMNLGDEVAKGVRPLASSGRTAGPTGPSSQALTTRWP